MNIDDIPGYLQPGAATALAQCVAEQLLRQVPGDFVEVGSYKGRSTVVIASVLRARGDLGRVLRAVDPHQGLMDWTPTEQRREPPTFAEFTSNVEAFGLTSWVRPHVGTVDTFPLPKAIAMAFIDGLHDKDNVLHDARALLPAMSDGALVCFHDYCDDWPGVIEAVDELVENDDLTMVRVVDTLAVVRR